MSFNTLFLFLFYRNRKDFYDQKYLEMIGNMYK